MAYVNTLDDYLTKSAQLDASTAWSWKQAPAIQALNKENLGDWLNARPADTPKPILVPVSGWYTRPNGLDTLRMHGNGPVLAAKELAATYGLHANTAIKKLNYTNATAAQTSMIRCALAKPSWYVSPMGGDDAIQEGQAYILVDDLLVTGTTIRDLVKHITLRGGTVAGVLHTKSFGDMVHEFQEESERQHAFEHLCLVAHYAKMDPQDRDALRALRYRNHEDMFAVFGISEAEKQRILAEVSHDANAQLAPYGLSVDQLTEHEMDAYAGRAAMLEPGESIWQTLIDEPSKPPLTPFLPAPVDKIENKAELAALLQVSPEQDVWASAQLKSSDSARYR